jgi:hypothetical protein
VSSIIKSLFYTIRCGFESNAHFHSCTQSPVKNPHQSPTPVAQWLYSTVHTSRKRNFAHEVPNPAGRRVRSPSPSSLGPQWRRRRRRRHRAVPSSTPPTSARSFPRPASPPTSSLSSGSTLLYAKSQATATTPPVSLSMSPSFILFFCLT